MPTRTTTTTASSTAPTPTQARSEDVCGDADNADTATIAPSEPTTSDRWPTTDGTQSTDTDGDGTV